METPRSALALLGVDEPSQGLVFHDCYRALLVSLSTFFAAVGVGPVFAGSIATFAAFLTRDNHLPSAKNATTTELYCQIYL